MSYQMTEFVLDLDGLSPTQKAVLHSLAYHADKDGGNSYPSMDTIASEAGLKHRRSAQRVVRRLEKKGILVAETPKTGGKNVTTTYRFNLEYCDLAVALSDGQTATVESSKQRPSGPQDGQTATIQSSNSDLVVARKVLKVLKVLRKEKSKRKGEVRNQTSLPSEEHGSTSRIGQGKTCPQNGRRELANEYFIWLIQAFDLILTAKERSAIETAILSGSCDSKLLKEATARNLDGLNPKNSFDRAGEKLAVNLPVVIEANRREAEQRRKDAENIDRIKERIQLAAECGREEEETGIEDTLAFFGEPEATAATV